MHKNTKIVLFGAVILAVLFFSSVTLVKAEDTATTTSTASTIQLARPAILPGSPLYFFKRLGEGFVNLFTFGGVNQAKRALDLSQVRLAEGQALLERNKVNLAQKSNEEYQTMLSEASQFAQKAQEAGKNVDDVLVQISQKTLKNQQVLLSVIEKAPEEARSGLQNAIQASSREHRQALQRLPEQKRQEVEAQDFDMNEEVQNKIDDLKLEGFDISEDLDADNELKQIENEINQLGQPEKDCDGDLDCDEPVVKEISISKLIPEQGIVGSTVTILGQGFTEINNTIKFSSGVILDAQFQKEQGLLTFKVPSALTPACFFNKLPCLMMTRRVVPGKHEVSVLNGHNKQSNTLVFNVIEKEIECKSASDCGKPLFCKNEKEYPAWSCNDGKCNQINYFRDPCDPAPSPVSTTSKEIN